MARKTTDPTTTRRSKKAAASPPTTAQVAPELQPEFQKEAPKVVLLKKEVIHEVPQAAVKPSLKNGKSVNLPGNGVSFNVEEQIRIRAYELYLQRRATAGSECIGDQNQDWLIAEREVRSRLGSGESRA